MSDFLSLSKNLRSPELPSEDCLIGINVYLLSEGQQSISILLPFVLSRSGTLSPHCASKRVILGNNSVCYQ